MATSLASTNHRLPEKVPAEETWERMEKNAGFPAESAVRDTAPQPDYLPLAGGLEGERNNHANTAGSYPSEKKRPIISGESVTSTTPWRTKDYTCDMVGLHEEVNDFYEYMKPRSSENRMRLEVAQRVTQIMMQKWRQADVRVFGSVMTGLFLPTSDIDLVVLGQWHQTPIFTLEEELKRANIAVEGTINPLDKTAVPVIKFIDKITEVKVDICFNRTSGVTSAEVIIGFIQEFPILPKLVLLLKQFLTQRNLHEVFFGGISSYALVLLVVSFLQLHPRNSASDPNANLGVLLMEFFELFGRNFNYMKTAITVLDGGSYLEKDKFPDPENALLYIVDPVNESENASRGCYGMWQVKQAFEQAFLKLNRLVLTRETPSPMCHSLLSEIVKVSQEVEEYRNWIDSTWVTPPVSPQPFFVPMVYPQASFPMYPQAGQPLLPPQYAFHPSQLDHHAYHYFLPPGLPTTPAPSNPTSASNSTNPSPNTIS